MVAVVDAQRDIACGFRAVRVVELEAGATAVRHRSNTSSRRGVAGPMHAEMIPQVRTRHQVHQAESPQENPSYLHCEWNGCRNRFKFETAV